MMETFSVRDLERVIGVEHRTIVRRWVVEDLALSGDVSRCMSVEAQWWRWQLDELPLGRV
jgi:hypothetical protein